MKNTCTLLRFKYGALQLTANLIRSNTVSYVSIYLTHTKSIIARMPFSMDLVLNKINLYFHMLRLGNKRAIHTSHRSTSSTSKLSVPCTQWV